MNVPRRHHFCPESYLARFTDSLKRDGILWVCDRSKTEVRKSKPKNEAHQKDFYRIDLEDSGDPFALEKDFSRIEDGASVAIEHICTKATLPNTDGLGYLLSFVGLLAVRTPSYRKKMSGFNEDLAKHLMDIAVADEERFELMKERLRTEGKEVPEVSYQEMRDFVDKEEYTVETHQNDHLMTMLTSAQTITETLSGRNWTVVGSPVTDLICSDNPVGLDWMLAPKGPWQSPGFGLPLTEVTIPLSKRFGLLGTFEKLSAKVFELDKVGAANFNNQALKRADRFIYMPSPDFSWRDQNGTVGDVKTYLSRHALKPAK